MSVRIRLPADMRELAEGKVQVHCPNANTVQAALDCLIEQYPDLRGRLLEADDQLKGHVHVFVGTMEIGELDGVATEVADEAELVIVTALAGG